MNFFKNILLIVALFTIHSLSPRVVGAGTPAKPAVQPQPVPMKRVAQPPIQQPPIIQQKQSYKNLVDYVKTTQNVWDNRNGILREDFVTTMIQKARTSNLDTFQLEALLQTARDIHGRFSGNKNQDITILQSVDNQIAAAIRQK